MQCEFTLINWRITSIKFKKFHEFNKFPKPTNQIDMNVKVQFASCCSVSYLSLKDP